MIINKYTSLFPLKLKFFQENFKVVCKRQTQTHTGQLSRNIKIAKNLIFQKVLTKIHTVQQVLEMQGFTLHDLSKIHAK